MPAAQGLRKDQPPVAKSGGNRHGGIKPKCHQHKQQRAYRRVLWVKPIQEPSGADPHPPDREEQQAGFDGAAQVAMIDQMVADLRDGKKTNTRSKKSSANPTR